MNTRKSGIAAGVLALTAWLVGGTAAWAQQGGDVLVVSRLGGVFQRYDPSARIVRISDIEYALSPKLKFSRMPRTGASVVFRVEGHDAQGRDRLVEISEK